MRLKINQNTILIVVFLLTITVPTLYMVATPIQATSLMENRNLAPAPELGDINDMRGLLDDVESFANDHFGFREHLVELNSWLSYFALGTPTNSQVIAGEEGWLYFNNQNKDVFTIADYYRGVLPPLTTGQLEAFRSILEFRNAELAAQGIEYYYVVTPDKHTIYGHYLPDAYDPVAASTWLDQIYAYMAEHSDVKMIDMRSELREIVQADPDTLYYYPLGTHWTSEGAWIGYQTIMDHLRRDFPDLQTVSWDRFVEPANLGERELAVMTGLINNLTTPLRDIRKAAEPCALSIETEQLNENWAIPADFIRLQANELEYFQCETAPNPQSVLFFRDSFSTALVPFFAETFETSAYIWMAYGSDMMQRAGADVQPDIVIEQAVERRLISIMVTIYPWPPDA